MEAILDTNILLRNLRGLRPSNDLKLVLSDARAGRFRLVVPKLVIDETANKARETAQDAERSLRKGQSDLATIGAQLELPEVDMSAVTDAYRERVMRILESGRVEVRDLPSVDHERLVRRDLDRRKPFAPSGTGYRDALIWETVLAAARASAEQVVLVTSNSRDFAGNKVGTQLADDLVADLREAGAVDRVRLVPDLATFKDEFVAVETITADELNNMLNSEGSPLREALFRGIADRLRSHVFDRSDILDRRRRDWELERLSLPPGTVDATLTGVTVGAAERLYGVWVLSAELSEGTVLFEFEAEVDAEVELEMEVEVEGDPFSLDEPWHVQREYRDTTVYSAMTLLVGGEATYLPESEELDDVAVFHVSY